MKKATCCVITVIVFVLLSALSYAQLSISPSISISEVYNDNIFLVSADKEDDFITYIFPEIELQYLRGEYLEMDLRYGLDFAFFDEHDEFNQTSLKETQQIEFKSLIRPYQWMFIDISDVYGRIPIDVRDSFNRDNEFLNMTERNIFSIYPYVVLPLTTNASFTIGYEYKNIWYQDEGLSDHETHFAELVLDNRFSSTISGALKYGYSVYKPLTDEVASNDEYHTQKGSAEISYQVTPHFDIKGEFGLASTDFTASENVDHSFWDIETNYIVGAIQTGAGYIYSLNESTNSGSYISNRPTGYFQFERIIRFYVTAYHEVNEYLHSDRRDEITNVEFELSRPLTERITALFDSALEKQKFLPVTEEVNKYYIGGSFEYAFSENLSGDIGYRFHDNDSDIDANDFQNNIIWLQAKMNF